jgi:hypothetical protein
LAVQGRIPLVIETHSVDVIATLIELKKEIEAITGHPLRMTVADATEAYLLASELAEAGVGVVLTRARPFPETWDRRRMFVAHGILPSSGPLTAIVHSLPGPPLSEDSAILRLLTHGVTVGVGVDEPSSAAATRFDLGWVRCYFAIPFFTASISHVCGIADRPGIWGSDFQTGSHRSGLHES